MKLTLALFAVAMLARDAMASYLHRSTSYAPAYLYRRYYRPVQYYDTYSEPRTYPDHYSYGPRTYTYTKPVYKVEKRVTYVSKPVVSVKYVKEPVVSYRTVPVKSVSYVKEPVVTYHKTKVHVPYNQW